MKKSIASLLFPILMLPVGAYANTSAVSTTDTNAVSTAANQGVNQGITFNSEASKGMKTTPSVAGHGFYGSFSGDSCVTSAGGGFSSGFFGASAVSPVRDEQCSVLRGVERTMQVASTIAQTQPQLSQKLQQGAIDMLCQLNDVVAKALEHQGVCSDLGSVNISLPTKDVNWGFAATIEH